jgi:hypothetical protein
MNEKQTEHARLLSRANDYLTESRTDLKQAEAEGVNGFELLRLRDVVRMDERVVEFLESNLPTA